MASNDLYYRMLGVNVRVTCHAPELRALIHAHWSHMAQRESSADITYAVARDAATSPISFARIGQPAIQASDEGELLYELEGDLNIALQQRRPDLFFLHAAVAEFDRGAHLLVAESGGGKSTTLWGLLHRGWRYMSDELAPVDLTSMQVHAYPRALCLKRRPPAFPLPATTIDTGRTLHVPAESIPQIATRASYPLAAAYFVKYSPTASKPVIRAISSGEAGARLYANGLNQLAHTHAGLDAAARIAKTIPAFTLDSADLVSTCDLVTSFTHMAAAANR